jgi:hypothetical protein
MNYLVNIQSFRSVNRIAFVAALRQVRAQGIRLIRVSSDTNAYGHVRAYRVTGRFEAARVADAAFDHGLCTWQA